MSRLFKRGVALTIARPQSYFVQAPNAVVLRGLRVTFSIEKKIGKQPNTCEVAVYNLSKDSRSNVDKRPIHVRLDAGYDDNLERLFTGDLIWSESKLDGVDWETKLQVADGARAFQHARVTRSFKPGVTLRTALAEVTGSLGLTMTKSALASSAMLTEFVSGLSLNGPAQREMTRLLAPHGLTWSIQDGRLQILGETEARTDQAIVVSQDAGMIGVPEYGSPTEKKKPPVLTVRMLLHPGLTPGGLIKVESRTIKGTFRVARVTHEGDTHGESWTSTVEAAQVHQ